MADQTILQHRLIQICQRHLYNKHLHITCVPTLRWWVRGSSPDRSRAPVHGMLCKQQPCKTAHHLVVCKKGPQFHTQTLTNMDC